MTHSILPPIWPDSLKINVFIYAIDTGIDAGRLSQAGLIPDRYLAGPDFGSAAFSAKEFLAANAESRFILKLE